MLRFCSQPNALNEIEFKLMLLWLFHSVWCSGGINLNVFNINCRLQHTYVLMNLRVVCGAAHLFAPIKRYC